MNVNLLWVLGLTIVAGGSSASAQNGAKSPSPYQGPTEAEERAAERWLAANAVPLSGSMPTRAELRPIVKRLSGARIIGLGEVTHGTHEDQAFKAELIKELIRTGAIDTVAIEANRFAIASFNKYVKTGAGDFDALVRSDSFFRTWRTDEFAELVRWVREWNLHTAKSVTMAGIDMQDGGRDSESALTFVASVEPAKAARWRRDLTPILGSEPGGKFPKFMQWAMASPADEFARARDAVTGLRDWYEAGAAKYGEKRGFNEGLASARSAWQGFAITAPMNNVDPTKISGEGPQMRDRLMAENLLELAGAAHMSRCGRITDMCSRKFQTSCANEELSCWECECATQSDRSIRRWAALTAKPRRF